MTGADKLIATAEAEIGYLEKKSNADLDSKTGNAGSNNYTKYNRDLKKWTGVGYINAQWCQAFVDWVFIVAFGVELAKKLIGVFTNYTPTGSNWFKKQNRYIKRGKGTPKRGDVIYFYSSAKGRIGHVGIVYKVSGNTVYTIEGNTSGASSLVTNGGGVKKKSYKMSSTYIDGYGSVDYSVLGGAVPETTPVMPVATLAKLGDRILKNGLTGSDVKEMQEKLISLGYDLGSYGADGDFGDCTEMAVRAFQTAQKIDVDGEFGPQSLKALEGALAALAQPSTQDKARFVEIETGKKCYIRLGPGTTYKDIGVAHSGDRLPYQGQTAENGWHLVEYKGVNAWVSGKYGKLAE